MPFVTLPGGPRLHYREQPGPQHRRSLPVVLVHGAATSSLIWLPIMRRLGAITRVLAPDLPGHGRSEPVQSDANAGSGGDVPCADLLAYARQVVAFAAACGEPCFVLVGHSMGGAVALEAAGRAGSTTAVAQLALVNSAAQLPIDPAVCLLAGGGAHHLEGFFAATGFSPALPASEARRLAVGLVAAPPRVAEGDFRACASFDARARLASLTTPTLLVVSDDDRLVPPALTRELAGQLGHARLQHVPSAGHFLPIERPEILAGALCELLAL